MKRILLIVVFMAGSIGLLQAQKILDKKFNSLELSDTRLVRIYTPPSYEKDKDRLFPLTIVLDGDFLFDTYVGNASLFALRDKAPEQIIVGIYQNESRERDCGYDKVTGLPDMNSNYFYRFIRGELLQFLQTNYRLSPFRTLVGYGLTANFVNYFAIEDHPAFDAYVLINPLMAEDMPSMITGKFSEINDRIVYYYLSTGSFHIESKKAPIRATYKAVMALENENIRLKYDDFDTTPTASISFAIASSLAHTFDIYSAISTEEYKKQVAGLDPPDAIAYLENKYVEIEYLFGTHMKIREKDIFAIEPIVIDKEDGLYLEDFGKMILKLYPESPIGDYYIGLFYEKARKYKDALKHYKNGYAKMDNNSRDAEAYYQNIERVLELQKTEKELKEAEKLERKAQKEAEKAEREKQKALYKEQKEKEKEQREKQKAFYKEQKQKEKEQREKEYENGVRRKRRHRG